MSNTLLLNGDVEDAGFDEIQRLNDRIGELEAELRMARSQAVNAKREAALAMGNLKKQLSPLYRALQMVFGELESVGIEDGVSPRANPRWESWKQRLPGRPAEFIDLLLLHKSMTIKQFMAATHCGQNTAYQIVSKLGQAGVTVNNGGKYQLKE